MIKKATPFFAALLLITALSACSNKPAHYYPMPESATLAVMPFTQPTNDSELLAGYIPADQHQADQMALNQLNDALMRLLSQSNPTRIIAKPGETNACEEIILRKGGKTKTYPLNNIIMIGQCTKTDYILVPQLIEWRERSGGDYGAVQTASVTLNLFLIDIKNKKLAKRYYFEENQAPLSENLLNIGNFTRRGGKYLSAHDLAVDGMKKGLTELGL